jgi:hypothetical protein
MERVMTRISASTIRELAATAGITPESDSLDDLAHGLEAVLAAIERCDALGLRSHEPITRFRLSGGAEDAQP